MKKRIIALLFIVCMILGCACGSASQNPQGSGSAAQEQTEAAQQMEKNGDVYILYTSDIHCGIDKGFGFAGLQQIRDKLEKDGYTTILVDDGDAIQGETIGVITEGDAVVDLMNQIHYDVAIPGNHEFDYGMDNFMKLVEEAEFPYISCNFNKEGELVLEPYVIIEAAGMKIAFVGATTPQTLISSAPTHFQNEEGEFIYGFLQQDTTGEALYQAVQEAVDAARADGADYVYLLGHLGNDATQNPWNYAEVISHTNGIDVVLDGHSHDTDQVVMKNKDGEDVARSACGTKMQCIGYSHISAEKGVIETNIWSWPNTISATEFFDIQNEISVAIAQEKQELEAELQRVIAVTDYELTIYDPVEKDSSGNPIHISKQAETNFGDFCSDAFRVAGNSDIGFINGGGIRVSLEKGEITYGDILSVFPFQNSVCVIEATGQQVLDALEWGARGLPGAGGCFLQVSGLTYEIDTTIPSGCIADENGMCLRIEGSRRVKNVTVGGEPLDPAKTYTISSINYLLTEHGSGLTAFDGAVVLQEEIKLDSQVLIDYLVDTLEGVVGEQYANPYGEGRITIIE